MEPEKVRLVCLPGGKRVDAPEGRRLPREALQLLQGGLRPDIQAAIEEAVEAARKMRLEIEERIARQLDDRS